MYCSSSGLADVPGSIQDLCWDDGRPSWIPRQRYVMTNSGNTWPTNATLVSAIKIYPPIITSITSNRNIVTLNWTATENCLEVSNYIIYQNDIIVKNIPATIFTADLIVNNFNIYTYFIIAFINNSIISEPSNTVYISIFY